MQASSKSQVEELVVSSAAAAADPTNGGFGRRTQVAASTDAQRPLKKTAARRSQEEAVVRTREHSGHSLYESVETFASCDTISSLCSARARRHAMTRDA